MAELWLTSARVAASAATRTSALLGVGPLIQLGSASLAAATEEVDDAADAEATSLRLRAPPTRGKRVKSVRDASVELLLGVRSVETLPQRGDVALVRLRQASPGTS